MIDGILVPQQSVRHLSALIPRNAGCAISTTGRYLLPFTVLTRSDRILL
jgi:hypothetical protein